MTTNLAKSFNVCLRDERHHSICSFLVEHMTKLGAMLVRHKAKSNQWKRSIRLKIDHKVKINIGKDEVYIVSPFSESIFCVFIGTSIFNVGIKEHSCTCRAWEMSGIPCKHACAVIGFNGQNVADFVDDQFKLSSQNLIYYGFFQGIETHDMPKVDVDGVVQVLGNEYFSLNPPCSKRPPGRLRKKRIQSQF